ncbi:hypothetical protein D1872_215660 [compost metagenome]
MVIHVDTDGLIGGLKLFQVPAEVVLHDFDQLLRLAVRLPKQLGQAVKLAGSRIPHQHRGGRRRFFAEDDFHVLRALGGTELVFIEAPLHFLQDGEQRPHIAFAVGGFDAQLAQCVIRLTHGGLQPGNHCAAPRTGHRAGDFGIRQRPGNGRRFLDADTGIFRHRRGIGQGVAESLEVGGALVHGLRNHITNVRDLVVCQPKGGFHPHQQGGVFLHGFTVSQRHIERDRRRGGNRIFVAARFGNDDLRPGSVIRRCRRVITKLPRLRAKRHHVSRVFCHAEHGL